MSAVIGGSVIGSLIIIAIIMPLIIWMVFVFPNVDGMLQDVDWYMYDNESQHFIFWSGFWILAMGFGSGILGLMKK